jgi:hypothetical protein
MLGGRAWLMIDRRACMHVILEHATRSTSISCCTISCYCHAAMALSLYYGVLSPWLHAHQS